MTQSCFGIAPEVLREAARRRKADLAAEKDSRIARMAGLAVDGRDLATGAVQADAGEKGRGQSGRRTCACGRTFYSDLGKTVCSRCLIRRQLGEVLTHSPVLPLLTGAVAKRRNKYHAERTEADGVWFDSKREAGRTSSSPGRTGGPRSRT